MMFRNLLYLIYWSLDWPYKFSWSSIF